MLPIDDSVAHRYPPVVTWSLIGLNVAAFILELSLGPQGLERFLHEWALVPARFFAPGADPAPGDWIVFVTNMFLHGGFLHLLLNMWTLWIFGPAVEDRLGWKRYLAFYMACGVAASLAHAAFNPLSTLPALGASGAIAGVIGAYARLFPFARLVVVVPVFIFPVFLEMPALIFALFWFTMQLIPGVMTALMPPETGGVAWWAHIGGFVAGWLLVPWLRRPPRKHRPYFLDESCAGCLPDGRRGWQPGPWR